MWYIVRLDSSRVATLVKVRSGTLVSNGDPTRVKSNYIPVYTTIKRQIERCPVDIQLNSIVASEAVEAETDSRITSMVPTVTYGGS